MGDIRICAFLPYPVDTAPSQRFRLEQWIPHLATEGIVVTIVPFADHKLMVALQHRDRIWPKVLAVGPALARRVLALRKIVGHDVVLIHRALSVAGPGLLETLIPAFGRPLVFDFDDAIYLLHTSAANQRLGWLKFPSKTGRLCRLSDRVVVANEGLASFARRYNSRVEVIPSSVDTDRFRPIARDLAPGRVVIGWTGSSTSQTYLEEFAPILSGISQGRQVEIRVHSDRPPNLGGLEHVWRPWSSTNEAEEIGRFDIGIMPMPDDPWARGKSAMKALLYMAMGIPVVCSPVGTNRDVIRHGENGFFAGSADEWRNRLEELVDDAALRARLGRAGRRTVEEGFSAARSAARFAGVIRELVRGS